MTDVKKTLGLTDREWESLQHRLAEGDALGEVLADDYAPQDVEDVAWMLHEGKLSDALAVSPVMVNDILRDAVEGSTWVGCAGNESEAKGRGAYKTLESLARKVAAYIGVDARDISVPTC